MIKFFRNIRQNLLNNGQSMKYFRYAIGEIILVVIGILIALQINTWNETRIGNKRLSNYRIALIDDIKSDTAMLGDFLRYAEKAREKLNEMRVRFSLESANFDSLYVDVQRNITNLIIINITSFNTVTQETIMSTGDINLFDRDISRQLVSLSKNQIEALSLSNNTHKIAFDRGIKFIENYVIDIAPTIIRSGPIYNSLVKNIDLHQFAMDFNSTGLNVDNHFRLSIGSYRKIFEESTNLLIELEKKENK